MKEANDERCISVALVEDHPEYRETIELALQKASGVKLIDTFSAAESALHCYSDKASTETIPDLILLDLSLPGISGLDAITHLKAILPEVKIVILTLSKNEADVLKAIALGASGYLLKSATVKQIIEGIRMVMDGGASLDPAVASFIVKTLKNKLPKSETDVLLTERERQVLSLLADGLVMKEIADKLGIGTSTVVTYIGRVYSKLDVKNAPAAVAKAFGIGILPVEEK